MKDKIKGFIKENIGIIIILLIALALRIFVLAKLGVNYNVNSDDVSYINSGIHFAKNFEYIMHGVISAQQMPGVTYIIALLCWIFGEGQALVVVLKILWILFGLCSIFGVYKIGKSIGGKTAGLIASIGMLCIDYAWLDNVILTETPYTLALVYLIYNSIQLANTKEKKYYWGVVVCYLFALLVRPTIAMYPLILFVYLILKKYDLKTMIKQGVVAGLIVAACIVPWTIRNYNIYHKFIPLTYGVGNPLLLGTYQGYGYPSDEELNYETNVYDKVPEVKDETLPDYMNWYYQFKRDEMQAKYRMEEWWKKDPISMIKSYIIEKPKSMLVGTFYWKQVGNITEEQIVSVRKVGVVISFFAFLIMLFDKKRIKENLLLILVFGYHLAMFAYTFAYSRYTAQINFIRYLAIGLMVVYLIEIIQKLRKKE